MADGIVSLRLDEERFVVIRRFTPCLGVRRIVASPSGGATSRPECLNTISE